MRDKGILERKFIRQVLNQEGSELVQAHMSAISRLLDQETGNTANALRMDVKDSGIAGGSLTVTHLKRQRFLDMKTRRLKSGRVVRKKAFKIHNAELYGRLNPIIRQLAFGFTQAVREKIIRQQTIEING